MTSKGPGIEKINAKAFYENERETLKVIMKLWKGNLPYAASMFCYLEIERLLKVFCIEKYKKGIDKTLGSLELMMSIPNAKYSNHRNDIMHSNLYFEGEIELSKSQRHQKNIELFKNNAEPDLIEVLNNYTQGKLSEKDYHNEK